ncbi:MAG: hypothetical protein VX805_05890 [Pseudomonadota bacterium]|nr:hypothetical protein [Pseudomonadota bacterium]
MNSRLRVKNNFDVIVGDYPFHQQLSDELVPVLENHPDVQGRKTNVKATMTDWDFDLEPKSSRIKKLKLYLSSIITKEFTYNSIGEYRPPMRILNFWANVYRKGDYTLPHAHWPLCDFSFAYFLKSKWYCPPLVFTHSGARIRPKAGRFVIFNSTMLHHVPKHRFKKSRITISGNWSIPRDDYDPNQTKSPAIEYYREES